LPATRDDGALAEMWCSALLERQPNILSADDQSLLAKMTKLALCSLLTECSGTESFHKSWLKKQLVSASVMCLVEMKDLIKRKNVFQQIATEQQSSEK